MFSSLPFIHGPDIPKYRYRRRLTDTRAASVVIVLARRHCWSVTPRRLPQGVSTLRMRSYQPVARLLYLKSFASLRTGAGRFENNEERRGGPGLFFLAATFEDPQD